MLYVILTWWIYQSTPVNGIKLQLLIIYRLKGLTRIGECDSCNQDESGEEKFKEHAAGHAGDGITANNQTLEEKAALRKIQEFAPPAPDEKGTQQKRNKIKPALF